MTDIPVSSAPPKQPAHQLALYRRITAYIILLAGYFLYCYNFAILDYVRPFIVESYDNISLANTAQFYTWQSLGALIGALWCASLANRFGKKNTLIVITAINGAGTMMNLLFSDYYTWAAMRFIIGIALGGYFTVAVSMMVGLFTATVRGRIIAFASSTFYLAIMIMGAYASWLSTHDLSWKRLMWLGGVPSLIVAILMIFLLPNDKKMRFSGEQDQYQKKKNTHKNGSWAEMLHKPYLTLTLSCVLLSGLNFYGYQFFSGFVTTYLKNIRQFQPETIGIIFSISAFGSLLGAWFWGAIADKWGRKIPAFGFIIAAVMTTIFFVAPSDVEIFNINLLAILGLIYNFGLSAGAIWGGYFSELFPEHLRNFGASLFHGGRIIGMWAPMVLVFIQERSSLETAMWGSPIVWLIAAMLWLSLPETLPRGVFYKKVSLKSA